ncbi:MAG: hypothetical protein SFX72_13070 [Isosphaeraceae bacterium]|nr:hypothetical protein [Isosphaeraceae bacterium]
MRVSKHLVWVGLLLVSAGSGCNETEVPIVQFPEASKTPPPAPPTAEAKAANVKAGVSQGDPSVDTR